MLMPALSVTVIGLFVGVLAGLVSGSVARATARGLVGAWLGFLAGGLVGLVIDVTTASGGALAVLGHTGALIGALVLANRRAPARNGAALPEQAA